MLLTLFVIFCSRIELISSGLILMKLIARPSIGSTTAALATPSSIRQTTGSSSSMLITILYSDLNDL
jgi:hypothetical protein